MLTVPKGYEYWLDDDGIRQDAPEWAVKEFQEYMEAMSGRAEDDVVIHA
ncbi:hypothetical protein HO447_00480 [Streptococcus suis]|nr:hypothetical protein [Streptococcus suis]